MTALMVFCNCPDLAVAERIADALVAHRLAACVNILPAVRAVYRWQGKIEQATEIMLVIKSTETAYAELESLIRDLHPYELPEILAVHITNGLPPYLAWVAQESTGSATECLPGQDNADQGNVA